MATVAEKVQILNAARTWADAGEQLGISADAARSLARRLRAQRWPVKARRVGRPRTPTPAEAVMRGL